MSEPAPLFGPLKPAVSEARLWTASGFVVDAWRAVPDETPLPAVGQVLISLDRWRSNARALRERGHALGIFIKSTDTFDVTKDDVATLGHIALEFPKFSNGRAYSTARQLRSSGYSGQLRATGDVLFDQMPLMQRSGFDTFQVVDTATLDALAQGRQPFHLPSYQAMGRAHLSVVTEAAQGS